MSMTKKNLEAVGRLLEAAQECFVEAERGADVQQRTPAHTITPQMYRGICRMVGADEETAYLVASFALSLVAGMAEIPSAVPSMCGSYEGGSLIVAFEALRNKISTNK